MLPYSKFTLGLGSAVRFLYQLKSSSGASRFSLYPSSFMQHVNNADSLTLDSNPSFDSIFPKYITDYLSTVPMNTALSYLPALERQRTLNACLSVLPLVPSLLPSIYSVIHKRVLFRLMARLFVLR